MNNSGIQIVNDDADYKQLIQNVGEALQRGRNAFAVAVNKVMVRSYWEIGQHIIKYEQKGHSKAEYGSEILKRLSEDLTKRYGKGFSRSNVFYMRKIYSTYPEIERLSNVLSWSHYIELMKLDDDLERSFYEKECESGHWGIRELKRQMKSMLFHRIALSADKKEVMRIAKEGQVIEKPEDILKDPYVFEFTGLPQLPVYDEGDLEEALVSNLSQFFLELGKGFTYVGRQQKMLISGRTYKVDLVFYHRILKCFVLVDLKRGGGSA